MPRPALPVYLPSLMGNASKSPCCGETNVTNPSGRGWPSRETVPDSEASGRDGCPVRPQPRVPAVTPCGACLQVLAEFGDADTEVWIDGGGRFQLRDLLPRPFAAEGPKPG